MTPEKARLIAYKSLSPHREYASTAWDPSSNKDITELEQVQNEAVRFISNVHGRDGIDDAKERLRLPSLQQCRCNKRVSLLMRILSNEERHPALSAAYEDILNTTDNYHIKTRYVCQTVRGG